MKQTLTRKRASHKRPSASVQLPAARGARSPSKRTLPSRGANALSAGASISPAPCAKAVQPQARLAHTMVRVESVIVEHFPEVLDAVKAALAVAALGCAGDNAQPTTLVFVAPASAGKSMALGFLMPVDDKDPLAGHFYRSDKLTAASFVSHRADLSKQQLQAVDLLPRLAGKTLLTKELAPMFSGKRDELTERFAVLTAVLDGQGYVSDSGAQGRRGYAQPINFQWLGATTPLSPEVLAVMAQLGPRMLFYDADRPRKDVAALVELANRADGEAAKAACRAAVRDLLVSLFQRYPASSVQGATVTVNKRQLRLLALWADALVRLRANVRDASSEELSIEAVEHPERVLGLLKNIAIGSALVHGRAAIADYDLAQIAHIALSSGVAGRQRVFRALLAVAGSGSTPEITKRAGVSEPTARRYMRELAAVGLARSNEGSPATVDLVEPYTELREAPLLKAKRGEGERPC